MGQYFLFNVTEIGRTLEAASDGEMSDPAIDETRLLLMPTWAYQSAAAYLIFISIFGLFLNFVVFFVIITDPQRLTPLNWMILNLACADGIIAGFGTSVSATAAFQYNWPFSNEMCVAYAMIMSTAGIESITTLTALALWRCQLVVYCPAKRSGAFANHHSGGGGGGSSAKLGRVQATILLTLIWAYSLAVTCPPLFGWGRYDREAAHISCSVNWESKMDNNQSYILYMFVFGLFVPMVLIVVSYICILRFVKKVTGKLRTGKKPESKKQQSDAAEKRVTVMVACMVGAFMAAWTPYSILALFETFIGDDGHSTNSNSQQHNNISSSMRQEEEEDNFFDYVGAISPAFATIPSLFAKTSAVLNPLIYGLLNTQFQMAWKRLSLHFTGQRVIRLPGVSDMNQLFVRRRQTMPISDSLSLPSLTVNLPLKAITAPDPHHSICVTAASTPSNKKECNDKPNKSDEILLAQNINVIRHFVDEVGNQVQQATVGCRHNHNQQQQTTNQDEEQSIDHHHNRLSYSDANSINDFQPLALVSDSFFFDSRQEQPVELVIVRLISESIPLNCVNNGATVKT